MYTKSGMSISVRFFLFIIMLSGCSPQEANNAETASPIDFILPTSYIGRVYIIIVPQEMTLPLVTQYDIPPSGVLIIKRPISEDWISEEDVRFYYRKDGKPTEITGRFARAPKETKESRADTEVKVFGTSVGEYEGIYADCIIPHRTYYVGKNTDVYDDINFFDLTEYSKNNSIDCSGLKPGYLRKEWLEKTIKMKNPN
ncbi:MAG: hypothetical protein COA42_21575 [Alteromonadaceae bacterium]|nr:MAG: hypothetical protein COA42_21575 [Alteromonadaceae bacterium]